MTTEAEPDRADRLAGLLRERIYGGVACLSTLLVLLGHLDDDDLTAWSAFVDVLIAAASLWAAHLLADFVADLAVHGHVDGTDVRQALQQSGQIVQAAAVPLLLLAAAGVGWMSLSAALFTGIGVSVAILGLFALLAARRTQLAWWKQAVIVASLVMLGAAVTAVKILAHG